ncbi:uncharacterized protein LOC142326850 [Lycorma delicatula]|uniref:uncharacterized protein LOC142326850 n=1 Tax=Lycorma delicatula TaxID=130591 RepID=UPI003F511199
MAVPILTYGSEVWVLRSCDESRIQAAEMRFLRVVKECTLIDRIRNEKIRRQQRLMPKLLGTLKEYRKRWSDHLMRMPLRRLPSQVWRYKSRGRRKIAHPRKRWMPEQAYEPNP